MHGITWTIWAWAVSMEHWAYRQTDRYTSHALFERLWIFIRTIGIWYVCAWNKYRLTKWSNGQRNFDFVPNTKNIRIKCQTCHWERERQQTKKHTHCQKRHTNRIKRTQVKLKMSMYVEHMLWIQKYNIQISMSAVEF